MLKNLVLLICLFNLSCSSKEETRWEDEYTDAYKSYEKIRDSVNLRSHNEEKKPADNGSSCQASVDLTYDDGCNTCSCEAGNWSCTEKYCSERPLPNPIDTCSEQKNVATIDKMNAESKTKALNHVAESLQLTALEPTLSLGSLNLESSDRIRPDNDPFPNSVIAVGESHDIRTEGYQLSNRTTLDSVRVYETEPGSNRFFIVDYLEKTENQESYGRPEYPKELNNSYSSTFSNWHSSLSNKLTLPSFYPRFSIPHEVYNCSCGEDESYFNYSEDLGARGQRFVAIYMLPGSERPTFDDTTIFEVEYQYIYQENACSRSID